MNLNIDKIRRGRILPSLFSIIILFAIFAVFVFTFHNKQKKHKQSQFVLGTIAEITIYSSLDKDKITQTFNECFVELKRLENKLSVYNKHSEVSKLNNQTTNKIIVSDELYYLLQQSLKISEQTQGAFDITVLPLIKYWKDLETKKQKPDQKEIKQILNTVGYKKIKLLNNNEIQIKPGVQIDLGGIAKGYAIDRVSDLLYNKRIENFLVNIGGDVYAAGKYKNKPWQVGLQDPKDNSNILDVFHVTDRAVVTSGDYQRGFTVDGVWYSHIIDPRVGWPVNGSSSVTIFVDTALYADAIATAVSVMGRDVAVGFLETHEKLDYKLNFDDSEK